MDELYAILIINKKRIFGKIPEKLKNDVKKQLELRGYDDLVTECKIK
ncbi:CD1375 family protein [Clostridium sp. VAP51]|nr:CD1375 family protein [Clostridium sp. VAP51]